MTRLNVVAISLMAAFFLSACGQRVETQVTTFHTLAPNSYVGKSFVMLPNDGQSDSLEWQQYAAEVSAKLTQYGLHAVSSNPDYAVILRYAIDNGRTSTSAAPIMGQTGGGTATTTGYVGSTPYSGTTYTAPTYGVTGYVPVSTTTFARAVILKIADIRQSTPEHAAIVYEGRASSVGTSGSLNMVMPAMLNALFTDWPGKSGSTRELSGPFK